MALHDYERQIAAEELLVLQCGLTTLASTIQTAFTLLAEASDVTTIQAAKTAYDAARNAYADYNNIRLPAVANTAIFTKIATEAAAS